MVKDKKTRGWKNLIKELSNTTHLFEMKWRPERGRRKGRRGGGRREGEGEARGGHALGQASGLKKRPS